MLRGLEVEGALRESRDARQNLVGSLRPHERLGILLMRVNELLDCRLEPRRTLEGAAAQLFVRQLGEPPLHETQPRPIRGCEMDVKPWTLGEPVANERRLADRGVIVLLHLAVLEHAGPRVVWKQQLESGRRVLARFEGVRGVKVEPLEAQVLEQVSILGVEAP